MREGTEVRRRSRKVGSARQGDETQGASLVAVHGHVGRIGAAAVMGRGRLEGQGGRFARPRRRERRETKRQSNTNREQPSREHDSKEHGLDALS